MKEDKKLYLYKKRAHKEVCTLLADNYFKVFEANTMEKYFVSLFHFQNGNRITIKVSKEGYIITKNGKIVKQLV